MVVICIQSGTFCLYQTSNPIKEKYSVSEVEKWYSHFSKRQIYYSGDPACCSSGFCHGTWGFCQCTGRCGEEAAQKKTINVSGQSKVTASPDFATISLGVVTEDKDAKAAQKANAESMDKVIESIKALGIDEADIRTVNYSISPVYSYIKETGESVITGYRVNNSVSVTVRDLNKTGSVIDAAADSGVNTSSSISFGISNYEDYYNEALKNAVLAANRKANTIADALGVKLKAP